VSPPTTLRLPRATPYDAGSLHRFLAGHAVPSLEHGEPAARHTRILRAPGGPALVSVDLDPGGDAMLARLMLATPGDRPHVEATLRRWLALDADPAAAVAALAAHPRLAPLVAARPGLRVPGTADGAETAILTVLGQQVSLAAARTLAGRLVAGWGAPAPEGMRAFPTAAALAEAGPERLRAVVGLTGARARAVHALAVALADGLPLAPGADPQATRAALLALPGIGPWTAEYLALRILGDHDAFPSGDLVLRRTLGVRTAREAERLAEPWRPWRGIALMHLWTAAVFA
jgi:3-methyladenine DNA glycosylase/8-oxoguanine DNA glycosylase